MYQHFSDANLTAKDVSRLTSPDAVAALLTSLGYDTGSRIQLSPEAIGLAGESAAAVLGIEVLSEDPEGFLRVVFVHLRSLTARARNDLARVLGRTNVDHLLILTSDFSVIEFVLLDKRKREARGPGGVVRIQVVPLSVAVDRKAVATKELRTLRRLTWTSRDGLEQFDKLRTVFEAAAFTEEYFCNRALFADHFLVSRLREDAAWRDNPTEAFLRVKSLLTDARQRWLQKGEQIVRDELFAPIFDLLGFQANPVKSAKESHLKPDYVLTAKSGQGRTAAFVYAWDRWLDGPDFNVDEATPEENPGACVVSALDEGIADWIIVTNGRQWRLYSRQAHSRATNFYEVDLTESLLASGDTDPNEAFRYWWLFFRAEAFRPTPLAPSSGRGAGGEGALLPLPPGEGRGEGFILPRPLGEGLGEGPCWLDSIAQGSREYAKRLGERLKDRIFVTIFPHLAQGFLEDRRRRMNLRRQPKDDELIDIYEATLTLLYRLLFLLYAESRDLLPIREGPYREASLKKIKEEIADKAGIAESEVAARIDKAFSATETGLYDRLQRLCAAMDHGDPSLNLPTYNGGLFSSGVDALSSAADALSSGADALGAGGSAFGAGLPTPPKPPTVGLPLSSQAGDLRSSPVRGQETRAQPAETRAEQDESREHRIARFLDEHKVADRYLALAIDRLARDPDEKTFGLVFIDYKSLEVRHLGSIYEGLLEFKLKVANEDLTTQTEKKKERYLPLGKAKPGRAADVVVRAGEVYLSNDKAERKASGSYYTPDPIVEYIVAQTVGPVLEEKLERLRPEFRKVRKTFDRQLANARDPRIHSPSNQQRDLRAEATDKTYAEHRGLVEDLFDFRVLDPAMGSGHFLVESVDFITDRLITFLNQFPFNPVTFMLDRTRRNILEALTEQGVAVDPDKLTEVNLLKRHVLKRSIYGVDLNPMAVELAKVSLWLDAFTIGAPLSFLDHHLRCGNSLVGATFQDLEDVMRPTTKGGAALFGIDYEPLLRAIRHVIQINKMADATAAEVKQSATEYDAARRDLSGYQIVLDLLVAKHFGHPEAPDLLQYGSDLDLSSRERFLNSLADIALTEKGKKREPEPVEEPDAKKKKTKPAAEIVKQVDELAKRPDLRFFHWDIEFPEVFFGFEDADGRRIKHKDRLAVGSAGFDAVVGNPPYVRMELIKPVKPFLKPHYRCHAERADLFIYFFERAVRLLRSGGRSAFIASSTWTKTKAGEGLREFLKSESTVESFLDFGDLPVFPEATTYPAVMVVIRKPPSPEHQVISAAVPDLDDTNLGRVLQSRRIDVPQAELEVAGWYFEDQRIARLRDKIRDGGVPLKDYCGSPLYGIKTGLNEAFVIDSLMYERFVAEDPRSKEILKPFLEGKDLKPWRYEWRGLWLIYTHHGVEIDRYRAIKAYLSTFRRRLEERATSEHHAWYELQQPQLAYSTRFAEPKIFYPHFCVVPEFCFDPKGFFGNDKTYCIPGQDRFLLGLLNSTLLWFMLRHIAASKRGGWSELRVQYVETIPIVQATGQDRERIAALAEQLSSNSCPNRLGLEAELNDRVASLYGLTAEERKLLAKRGTAGRSAPLGEED